jgi:hypothetical protein
MPGMGFTARQQPRRRGTPAIQLRMKEIFNCEQISQRTGQPHLSARISGYTDETLCQIREPTGIILENPWDRRPADALVNRKTYQISI